MDFNKTLKALLVAALTSLFVFAVILIFNISRSNGQVEHCYIISDSYRFPRIYMLYGYMSWRMDRKMGTYLTFEEAVKDAQSINCKVN